MRKICGACGSDMGEATPEEVLTAMVADETAKDEPIISPEHAEYCERITKDEETGEEVLLGYDGCDDRESYDYDRPDDLFPKDHT